MDNKIIGSFIRKRRKVLGYSQIELAKRLHYSTPQFISNIERGLANIPLYKLGEFAEILKVNPEKIARMLAESVRDKIQATVNVNLDNNTHEPDSFLKNFIDNYNLANQDIKNAVKIILNKVFLF